MPGEMGRIYWGVYYTAYIFMDLRSEVSSLFSITPSNFEVAKTGASSRFSLASLGEFDLRACMCGACMCVFVSWNGRGMPVSPATATKLVLQL
jgi:hypothetical protein